MPSFFSSDWFIIGLEIVFLILIIYDTKRYIETKKREYIVNIVLTLAFAIWALMPYYNSYFKWNEVQKQEYIIECNKENNQSLCACLSGSIFKEYGFEEYNKLDKKSEDYKEFFNNTKKECLDNGWF